MQADVLNSPALLLLIELEADGFALAVENDELFVKPATQLTADVMATIKAHRQELLMLLRICDEGVQERRRSFTARMDQGVTVGRLVMRDRVPYAAGHCFSCADPLPRPAFGRCWRCALAWRLAVRVPIRAEIAKAYDDQRLVT